MTTATITGILPDFPEATLTFEATALFVTPTAVHPKKRFEVQTDESGAFATTIPAHPTKAVDYRTITPDGTDTTIEVVAGGPHQLMDLIADSTDPASQLAVLRAENLELIADLAVSEATLAQSVNLGAYVARDRFPDDMSPLVSGDAVPGPGQRTVIGDRWYTSNGVAYGGSTVGLNVFGGSVIAEVPIDRANGRVVSWFIRPEDVESYLAVVLGSNPTSMNPVADGYAWLNRFGELVVGVPGREVKLLDTHYATGPKAYLASIVLFDEGAAILLSSFGPEIGSWRSSLLRVPAFPQARVVYVTHRGTQESLTPYSSAAGSPNAGEAIRGHQVADYRVTDPLAWQHQDALATFADRFERANGALANDWTNVRGSFGIVNNRLATTDQPGGQMAHVYRDIGVSDGIYLFDFTTGPVVGHFAGTFRHTAPGDFLRVTNNGNAGTVAIQRYVGGGFNDSLFGGPIDPPMEPNTRYVLAVIVQDNEYLITLDDVVLTGDIQRDLNNYNLDGTGIGFGTFDTVADAATVNMIACYPHYVTLPAELQAGMVPQTRVYQKLLASYGATPIVGSGNVVVPQAVGVHTVRVETTIRLGATIPRWVFIGPVPAYLNAQNWFAVRAAADHAPPPDGQLDDEIEVVQCLDGVVTVVGKVQFREQDGSFYYTPNRVIKLSAQISVYPGGYQQVDVLLDGDAIESYPLPLELYDTTSAGVYADRSTDPNSEIESWAVYTD